MSSENYAVIVDKITKSFKGTKVLDEVSFKVKAGEIFALLGPNGAGKTTLVRIMATLLNHDSGSVSVLGLDLDKHPEDIRKLIGLTGQYASVDEDLSGIENLMLIGRLLGLAKKSSKLRALQLLEAFDLLESKDKLVKTYSGGMRRRIDIAASIIFAPKLMFLDEPTTGLDPHSRNEVWDIVRALVKAGTTVILTTQYLHEADELADQIIVIDHGRVIAQGTAAELKARVGDGFFHVKLLHESQAAQAIGLLTDNLKLPVELGRDGLSLTIRVKSSFDVAHCLSDLAHKGIEFSEFSLGQPSLDEVFLALTDKSKSEVSNG